MSRSPRARLLSAAATLSVAGLAAGPIAGDPVLINNGLAPPNPANVIEDPLGSGFSEPALVVRNEGCTELSGPCPSPGDATTVAIAPGGSVYGGVDVYDSSTLAFAGGTQQGELQLHGHATLTASAPVGWVFIQAYDDSSIVIEDGGYMAGLNLFDSTTATIDGYFDSTGAFAHGSASLVLQGGGETLGATDDSLVELLGGTSNYMRVSGSAVVVAYAHYVVWDALNVVDQGALQIRDGGYVGSMRAWDTSIITIAGHDFEICDGPFPQSVCAPVGLGLLSEQTGTLRGTSLSGETITVNELRHGGYFDGGTTYTGQIRLVPEPSTGALLALGLAGLAAARRNRLQPTGIAH